MLPSKSEEGIMSRCFPESRGRYYVKILPSNTEGLSRLPLFNVRCNCFLEGVEGHMFLNIDSHEDLIIKIPLTSRQLTRCRTVWKRRYNVFVVSCEISNISQPKNIDRQTPDAISPVTRHGGIVECINPWSIYLKWESKIHSDNFGWDSQKIACLASDMQHHYS